MVELGIGFIVSAFFAGLLTFLAPCTLPLVPAYLGFISGVSPKELQDPETAEAARRKVFFNGLFFIVGFSVVFIVFGTLAGLLGQALVPFRQILTVIGGLLVILFGLFMLGAFNFSFLQAGGGLALPKWMHAGSYTSSLMVGGAFAFGWTPCVGPILASILLLASTEGSALSGAVLLSVFSLGLAVPFLIISLAISRASKHISAFFRFLSRWRVPIFAFFGLVLGLLLNIVLVSLITVHEVFAGVSRFGQLLLSDWPWVVPAVVAAGLGLYSWRKKEIDVLGVIGGLFLIALGILLATNSFSFLVQYGFQIFDFFGYEGILEYL